MQDHPQHKHQKPPFPEQQQDMPGYTEEMDRRPDHGVESYRGSGNAKSPRSLNGRRQTEGKS
jgi:hypothetical protein